MTFKKDSSYILKRKKTGGRASCLATLKGAVGLITAKASAMRVTIPLDLSSRPFIPLHAIGFCARHSFIVTPSFP